jgi:hypothetical protein
VIARQKASAGPTRGDVPGHSSTKFARLVALAIALVSVLGALVAFGVSTQDGEARRLDGEVIQQTQRREQILSGLESQVDRDQRNLGLYQEHLKAADLLRQQAASLQGSDPTLAIDLRAQALDEDALARARLRFFSAAIPSAGAGPVEYDRARALARLTDADDELRKLRPEATSLLARRQHERTDTLAGLVALIVASLIFLTVAQFARSRARIVFATAGSSIALAATLLAGYVSLVGG